MSIVNTYNNLKGQYTRGQLKKVLNQAKQEGVWPIVSKLSQLLRSNPKETYFHIQRVKPLPFAERNLLNGLEQLEPIDDGLGKAVEPNEIYQLITDTILKLIDSGKELPWRKPWDSIEDYGLAAANFVSKKPYRGINALLLNFIWPETNGKEWDIPYFLTFKQVEKLGGKIKKDSEGYKVVYFTMLYKYEQDNEDGKLEFGTYNVEKFIEWLTKNAKKITPLKNGLDALNSVVWNSEIPILKYYNVFNADDITGIDFKIKKQKPKSEFEKIEAAEGILNNMPNPPKMIHKGIKAFYATQKDILVMPPQESFESEASYYSVKFHEAIHSTGHKSRLKRNLNNVFGTPEYAFEELIAELGAAFLSGESGILYHTIDNSSSYLQGWRKRLKTTMENDNRFFFRAASASQAAADYILDRDKNGIPAYISKTAKKTIKIRTEVKPKTNKKSTKRVTKKTSKPTVKNKPETKVNKRTGQMALFGIDNDLFHVASKPLEEKRESFRLKGPIGDFLQDLQRYRLAIVLTGDPHAGKSEFAKQMLNSFLDYGLTAALWDLEQGGLISKDTKESIDRNISKVNQEKLAVAGEAPKGLNSVKEYANKFDVVMIDSWQKLGVPSTRFDELRMEYPNTIWIIIFQQNSEGGTRGGVTADYDTPIKIKVHKHDLSFVNNYAELQKNRGNTVGLLYNVANKKIITQEDLPKEE